MERLLQRIDADHKAGAVFINFDFGRNWSRVVEFLKRKDFADQLQKDLFDESFKNHLKWLQEKEAMEGKRGPEEEYTQDYWRRILHARHGDRIPLDEVQFYGEDYNVMLIELMEYGLKIKDPRMTPEFIALASKGEGYLYSPELAQQLKVFGIEFRDQSDKSFYWLGNWCLFWMCWFLELHVSLPLAKMMFPDKNWQFVKGRDHATVVCVEERLIFDLAYWGLDGRRAAWLKHEMFGTPLPGETDVTLGGNRAVIQVCL